MCLLPGRFFTHIHHTHINELGYKLQTGYQNTICTPDSLRAAFIGTFASVYHKNLCVYYRKLYCVTLLQRAPSFILYIFTLLPVCVDLMWPSILSVLSSPDGQTGRAIKLYYYHFTCIQSLYEQQFPLPLRS